MLPPLWIAPCFYRGDYVEEFTPSDGQKYFQRNAGSFGADIEVTMTFKMLRMSILMMCVVLYDRGKLAFNFGERYAQLQNLLVN